MMKTHALLVAVALTAVATGCGGADTSAASTSDAATISCTTETLGAIFTTDCSTASGADLVSCLVGTPPVCEATPRGGCACTGEGTNLYAATTAVGLCGGNAAQTRAGLLRSLCATEVDLSQGEVAKACVQIQDFERKVFEKQVKALDKDINSADADALRGAAQQVEAAFAGTGVSCPAVTPAVQ